MNRKKLGQTFTGCWLVLQLSVRSVEKSTLDIVNLYIGAYNHHYEN